LTCVVDATSSVIQSYQKREIKDNYRDRQYALNVVYGIKEMY